MILNFNQTLKIEETISKLKNELNFDDKDGLKIKNHNIRPVVRPSTARVHNSTKIYEHI